MSITRLLSPRRMFWVSASRSSRHALPQSCSLSAFRPPSPPRSASAPARPSAPAPASASTFAARPPQIAVYTFPVLWLALLIVSILKFNLSCAQSLPPCSSVSRSADRARHLNPFPTAPRAHPRLRNDPASCQLSSSRSSSTSRTPSGSHTRAFLAIHVPRRDMRTDDVARLCLLITQRPRCQAKVGKQPRLLGLGHGHGRHRRPDPLWGRQEQRRARLWLRARRRWASQRGVEVQVGFLGGGGGSSVWRAQTTLCLIVNYTMHSVAVQVHASSALG